MIVLAIAAFAFLIFFGTLVQNVFKCSVDTAFNVSASVTGLGLVILIAALM
jgi:hypothetical protein